MRALILLLALFAFLSVSRADIIVKTQPSKKLAVVVFEGDETYEPDEQVCLKVEEISLACGDVFKTAEKGVILYIYHGMQNLHPGRHVELVRSKAAPRSRLLLLGAATKFPTVQFQQLFANHLSYGILTEGIILRNGTQSFKGMGAMITLNYYSGGVFKGFWAMGGAGIHLANLEDTAAATGYEPSLTSGIFHGSLGWRFRISDFTFAVAGGAQYFLASETHAVVRRSGLLPVVMADIGLLF